jgi:hypothetical protein
MISSRSVRWEGQVAYMKEKKNAHRVLVGKPGGRRSLEIPRCRWKNNIKTNLREIEWSVKDVVVPVLN